MMGILEWVILGGCGLAALYCVVMHKKHLYRKAEKMHGYFEFDYYGKRGTSRDYGPMLEIDMVGAMKHRQECGAQITFFQYGSCEEILDLIDQREYLHQQQSARRPNF